ncbi:MAG TPA: type I methionyl aminopeptidase [Thermomicrobiaceae bacterium]|nr:type I methionyl aminopeptidase [Thermomicrobiaceae bacterium]
MMAITLKSSREVALMRSSGIVVAEVLALMREHVRPGVTTGELNRIAHEAIVSRGAVPSFLGYEGFPGSICTSINEQVVHGIPGRRRLHEGDIVSLDVGAILDGYHGDAALTLPVGEVSDAARRLIEATEGAFWAGMAELRPGNRLGDVAAAIQEHAESRGFSLVRDFSGHGIGQEMHEEPSVPNVGERGTGLRLRAGMTLAVEPMLTAGGPDTDVLADKWTVVTADGSLAAHFEHTVLVGEDGPVLLTAPAEV